jgi:hypothetical protein
MTSRFNAPPGWHVPQGDWSPSPEWSPDPRWPQAPPGWRFWPDDDAGPSDDAPPGTGDGQRRSWRSKPLLALVTVVGLLVVGTVFALVYRHVNAPHVDVLDPVDARGNVSSGWVVDRSREGDSIDCSYGSPSRYDKSGVMRDCGATADSADACWAAADGAHVLCLQDPFSNELHLIGATGLNKPRNSLTEDPTPIGLELDDGTQCRARNGGAWSPQQEHPGWVGYYGCKDGTGFDAVWGPTPGDGTDKGFGGWTVQVGSETGHLVTHEVTRVLFVGVASGGGDAGGSGGSGGGTRLVTKCGRTPDLVPETVRADTGALVIRMKIVAHCPGGDVLSSSNTRVSVTSGDQNVASGIFDLSAQPIVVAPGSNGGESDPWIEHDFRFPVGTFWRLPVSTTEAPTNGASESGAVDLDVKTLVVACDQNGSARSDVRVSNGSESASTATSPAQPQFGDAESASFDALRALANADRPFVSSQLADRWVPQLSSKRPGLVADGITWHNAETLHEHLQLRLDYPEVRLLWSGDWSTFSASDFWVTIAGVTFADAEGALGWCRSHNLDRDHCYAKLVSSTHPVDGSTAFNP